MKPAAIILAGGRSSRFGADKLAARLDGIPVLEHALRAVARVADPVVVVVSPDAPSPSVPADLRVEVVPARDLVAHQGPLAGLVGGLAALGSWAASAGEGASPDVILLVAGDMPSLMPGVLELLAAALDADPSLGAAALETEPPSLGAAALETEPPSLGAAALETEPPSLLPSAIRASIVGPVARALLAHDRRSLRGLLESVPASIVPSATWRALDPDGRTLRDIDTPEDLSGR